MRNLSSDESPRCERFLPHFLVEGVMAALLGGFLLAGCGKGDPEAVAAKGGDQTMPGLSNPEVIAAKKQFDQAKSDIDRSQAMKAVMAVGSMLDDMQGGGGYQEWTAQKAADKLVPSMNIAEVPDPAYPVPHGRKFTYVHGKASAPWQVAIKVDGDSLIVSGYGEDLVNPLATQTIKVSRY